jgi:hypothetical protein
MVESNTALPRPQLTHSAPATPQDQNFTPQFQDQSGFPPPPTASNVPTTAHNNSPVYGSSLNISAPQTGEQGSFACS